MDQYYDDEKLLEDVTTAIEQALAKHGLEPFSLLGVTTVMSAIASPLKYQMLRGHVGRKMGKYGIEAYGQAHLARRVALLQSPHSKIVNLLMECIVVALADASAPLSDERLELATVRIFVGKPRLSAIGLAKAKRADSSIPPAFRSAQAYLVEGQIITRDKGETGWILVT